MSCSPEQLAANRQNAAKSSGPKTEEGKAISRQNGLKHGLAGEGIVIPAEDQAEVAARADRFRRELKPADSIAQALVIRLAVMAVRMERCVEYETAVIAGKVREVMNDPSIETEAERRHAIALAKFDHSPESASVRRYEAASSREFFKTLRALECHEPSVGHLPESAPVYPTSIPAASCGELASSRQTAPVPPPREPAPTRPTALPPLSEESPFARELTRAVLERASATHNPINFAIGKPPGSKA